MEESAFSRSDIGEGDEVVRARGYISNRRTIVFNPDESRRIDAEVQTGLGRDAFYGVLDTHAGIAFDLGCDDGDAAILELLHFDSAEPESRLAVAVLKWLNFDVLVTHKASFRNAQQHTRVNTHEVEQRRNVRLLFGLASVKQTYWICQ
jgi:hypothetical protein